MISGGWAVRGVALAGSVSLFAGVATPAVGAPAVGAPTAGAPAGPAAAVIDGTFSGTASADAVRVRVAVEKFLIVSDFVDGGGPSAQAALDSLGESTAFSSFPYPGATATALPGVVATLTGKSLVSYPLIANSDYPSTPKRTITQPGLHLQSASSPTRSEALTQAGATVNSATEAGAFARASVTREASAFTSRAEVRAGLSFAGVRLSGVSAHAEVTYGPDGTATKSSSLAVAALEIAGTKISVTDRGLMLGSSTIPLNALDAVSQAISTHGTSVTFLPASSTEDSVLSAGLEISTKRPLPQTGGALAVITFTLGRAFAQANSTAFGAGFPVSPDIDPVAPVHVAPNADSGRPAGTPGYASEAASGPRTGAFGAGGQAEPVPALPALPAATPAVGSPTTSRFVAAPAAEPRTTLTVYPILALTAGLLVAGAFGMRRVSKMGI